MLALAADFSLVTQQDMKSKYLSIGTSPAINFARLSESSLLFATKWRGQNDGEDDNEGGAGYNQSVASFLAASLQTEMLEHL